MSAAPDLQQVYAALVEAVPAELLRPLVEQSGGRLLAVDREDVGYRPGRDAHVRLAATVERGGATGREGWVVSAGDPPGQYLLQSPAGTLSAWRVRDDPQLPGLRSALDVAVVAGLLAELGVPHDGLSLQLLAYRPRRRAVVSATTPGHQLFLKCVPPEAADALQRRHLACRQAGLPTPRSLGHDGELGLLVLTPLHGTALRAALLSDAAGPLPEAGSIVALLDAFSQVALEETARDPVRQARGHAALLRAVVPAEAARVDDLLGRVRAACDGDSRRAVIHGDLHDDQLLVRENEISGVVDVDGAGVGHPADDAANLLAHLLVLRDIAPAGRVASWLPEVAGALLLRHEPDVLGARTAAVLLGLATWPHSHRPADWPARTGTILALAEGALAGAEPA